MDLLRTNAFLSFLLILATATTVTNVSAESSRTPASSSADHPTYPDRSSFQAVSSSRALSQRDLIFRTILSTEGKDLTWPSFPRTWHEQTVSEYLLSNTAVGLNALGASGNLGMEYKWVLKSSLVLIAGNRMEEAALDPNAVTVEPAADPLQLEIFKWDPVSRRTLPNVHKGYPMVAFCAFEATLNVATTSKGGFTFMGNGQTVEAGKVRTVTHTLFSRFFQVDGTQSPIEMLDRICAGDYRKQVESYVQRDFSRAVAELYAYTKNECDPDPKNDGPNGDASCMDWFHKNINGRLQTITVPRCVQVKSGTNACQLMARENGSCPMYWDGKSRSAVQASALTTAGYHQKATDNPFEFQCDAAAGLTCAMVKQPWVALNVPFWPGTARCVRK